MNSSDERDQAASSYSSTTRYPRGKEKVEEREKKLRDTKKRRTTSILGPIFTVVQ